MFGLNLACAPGTHASSLCHRVVPRYTRLMCCWIIFLLTTAMAWAGPDFNTFYQTIGGRYEVLTPHGDPLGREVNVFMNQMLQQYSRYFNNWTLKPGARVIVFATADDFRTYTVAQTGIRYDQMTGYCQLRTADTGETYYELVTYAHDDLYRVLAHEGFHQFLGYELGDQVPLWLNEGLAQYFETSEIRHGRLATGLVSRRKLAAAQAWIQSGQAPGLTALLHWDAPTFYANAAVAYPMSWALVYYLLNRDGTSYRSSAFRRYLHDLKLQRDDVQSFQRRFGRESPQWQRDFEHFILYLQPHVE